MTEDEEVFNNMEDLKKEMNGEEMSLDEKILQYDANEKAIHKYIEIRAECVARFYHALVKSGISPEDAKIFICDHPIFDMIDFF